MAYENYHYRNSEWSDTVAVSSVTLDESRTEDNRPQPTSINHLQAGVRENAANNTTTNQPLQKISFNSNKTVCLIVIFASMVTVAAVCSIVTAFILKQVINYLFNIINQVNCIWKETMIFKHKLTNPIYLRKHSTRYNQEHTVESFNTSS